MTPATQSAAPERNDAKPAAQFCIDRQQLQKLNELLAHYDLSSDSRTDNSDLRFKLCALMPADFKNL